MVQIHTVDLGTYLKCGRRPYFIFIFFRCLCLGIANLHVTVLPLQTSGQAIDGPDVAVIHSHLLWTKSTQCDPKVSPSIDIVQMTEEETHLSCAFMISEMKLLTLLLLV